MSSIGENILVVVKDQERVVALRVQNERFYADGPDWG